MKHTPGPWIIRKGDEWTNSRAAHAANQNRYQNPYVKGTRAAREWQKGMEAAIWESTRTA